MARSSLFTWKLSAIFRNLLHANAYRPLAAQVHQYKSLNQTIPQSISESQLESETESESEGPIEVQDLKIQILKAGLDFVPEHGWTKTSLSYGAKSLGLATSAHSLIVGGGAQLVHYFNFSSNQQLGEILQKEFHQGQKFDLKQCIEYALETRLRMVEPYVSNWKEALALMLFPNELPEDSKNLLDLADIIWNCSADKSLDVRWYTKRLSLAAAYKACELSLIQDKSPDFVETFDFLERQADVVVNTSKLFDEVTLNRNQLEEIRDGAFITVRNLLGFNRWLR
ncbi:ubiquinone biosynthesis protein COQ9, mitochondrial-like [Uloborus diversus]|uniref:ubiquinone biosynthesis protein COQ9, mitochondrial-like n=1 Tax=Uloborus diversus TaxID=327109 RepID=UPI002409399D|nr:ubiquinone biosynthesis protein COQ9, mitochondrial-like [Uloborus diversus]